MTITTVMAAMSGVPLALLTNVTTGTGTPIAIPPSFRNHTFIIASAAGVSAGTIALETANDPNDANTWSLIQSITAPAGGAETMYQAVGIFNFVRARVTTNISGGTQPGATVTYEGAKSY